MKTHENPKKNEKIPQDFQAQAQQLDQSSKKEMKKPASSNAVAKQSLKRPASLKPILKRPSSSKYQNATKKLRKEEKEEPEGAEEAEEEDKEEDQEVEPEPAQGKRKLTKKALKDHNLFVDEIAAQAPTYKEFETLLAKGDKNMVMRLWKQFEASRKSNNQEETFKELTSGSGSLAKKKELLRSWVLDGGKPAKHFKECCHSFKLSQGHSLEGAWLSKKQALDAIGPEELKARVMAGTIQTRRNKQDSRFWEFRIQTEKDNLTTTKEIHSRMKSDVAAQKEEVLQFDSLFKEDLTAADFSLAASSSQAKGVSDDLAKVIGLTRERDENKSKQDKESKWEKESKISSQSTKATMEKHLMKFKAEVAKEESLLETVLVDAKGASMEQNKKLALNKAVKKEIANLTSQKAELAAMLNKKSLKVEMVKEALQAALTTLTSAKKMRVGCQKSLKGAEDAE